MASQPLLTIDEKLSIQLSAKSLRSSVEHAGQIPMSQSDKSDNQAKDKSEPAEQMPVSQSDKSDNKAQDKSKSPFAWLPPRSCALTLLPASMQSILHPVLHPILDPILNPILHPSLHPILRPSLHPILHPLLFAVLSFVIAPNWRRSRKSMASVTCMQSRHLLRRVEVCRVVHAILKQVFNYKALCVSNKISHLLCMRSALRL